jgi:hypothetical protein
MSQSNAAARKRRAPATPPQPPMQQQLQPQQQQQPQQPTTGLTLPQVISLIDKRLTNLEKSVSAINEKMAESPPPTALSNNVVDEFDERYNLLAQETGNLKNMLLSLQTYTMEVNKKLVDSVLPTTDV